MVWQKFDTLHNYSYFCCSLSPSYISAVYNLLTSACFLQLNATFDVYTTKGDVIKDLLLSLSICKSICWFLILRWWCSRNAKSNDYYLQIWSDRSVLCISRRKLEPLNLNQKCSFCLLLNLCQSRGYGWKLLCQQASDMLKYPEGWN